MAVGNTRYHWDRGDADLLINERGGTDTLNLGTGISSHDLSFARSTGISSNNLILTVGGDRGGSITINNYFASDDNKLESIRFNDGSTLDISNLQIGTTGNDTLTGTANADVLVGLGGGDLIYGKDGDDWIDGGAARDHSLW